ncbi:MAG: hypothetical protein WHV67_07415 [Thermoanaerobaculia bacterium]
MLKFKKEISKKFSKKEEGLKRRKDGSIIWRDIVQADLPLGEQNWVLDFKDSDIPEFLKIDFGVSSIAYRKSFVVRDLYKMLVKDDYFFCISPKQKWWFEILMDKNIQILKILTLGKPCLAKFFANWVAIIIAEEIKFISIKLSIEGKSKNFNENLKNMKEKIKQLNDILTGGKGYGTDWGWKLSALQKTDIPPEIWEKIKGIGYKVRGYFYSLEKKQSINSYPKTCDWSLADEILFLDKIEKGFPDLENRTKNLKVDLYLDTSFSMKKEKLMVLKGIVSELKRAGIKFRKIYRFCTSLLQIKEKDIWNMDADGGTNIEAVLENVKKNSFYSVIISDMEDNVRNFVNILKIVESKISLIQVGERKVYEEWKNYVGIAYFIEIEEKS